MRTQEQYHLENLANGCTDGLAYIISAYQLRIYNFCFRLVHDKLVAEEITMDVFLKLWEKRAKIDPSLPINGLLFKITKDYCISYLRKASRIKELREAFIKNYIERIESSVETEIWIKEGLKIADTAIDYLPPRCKQVFQLRYLKDLSLRQISDEMGISISTTKKQLSKGTRIIRAYLKAHPYFSSMTAFALIMLLFPIV